MTTGLASHPITTPNRQTRAVPPRDYEGLLARLSRASVNKYYLPYTDIPWEDPDYAIDPEDPRWILRDSALARTEWFRSRPASIQARLSLHMSATFMKFGAEFENALSRGLLEFASLLPNGSPEFRYAYHEVIEESHHSLMFQEFVNRTGLPVRGLGPFMRGAARHVATLGRWFPELFFVFVLGGEDPIDHQQRVEILGAKHEVHPLLRRVSQIHVSEEARHISFARAFLRERVPALSAQKMMRLRIGTPIILGAMASLMMEPPPDLIRLYGIPREVVETAFGRSPEHRARVRQALAKVTELCRELDVLVSPYDRMWRRAGLIEARGEGTPAA